MVLIPAHNEENFIGNVVKRASPFVAEVVVVDDGSTDLTAKVAFDAGATVIKHPQNKGKGAALWTGLQYALKKKYKAVLTMDGDGQHLPEEIPKLVACYRQSGAGVILGCRPRNIRNMPLDRLVTNWFTSLLISLLVRQRIRDSQCGFRIIDAQVIPHLSLATSHFDTESEILVQTSRNGFKISEVEISTIYGSEKSKIKPGRDTRRFFRFFFRSLLRR